MSKLFSFHPYGDDHIFTIDFESMLMQMPDTNGMWYPVIFIGVKHIKVEVEIFVPYTLIETLNSYAYPAYLEYLEEREIEDILLGVEHD